jgi:hypothetical protein
VRGKQIGPVPFYRQKPLGGHIVDFHAPKAKATYRAGTPWPRRHRTSGCGAGSTCAPAGSSSGF